MTDSHEKVQRYVGYIAVLAFLLLAWQSLEASYDLSWQVIAGLIIIVAMLLGKVDKIAHLLEKWRGG